MFNLFKVDIYTYLVRQGLARQVNVTNSEDTGFPVLDRAMLNEFCTGKFLFLTKLLYNSFYHSNILNLLLILMLNLLTSVFILQLTLINTYV